MKTSDTLPFAFATVAIKYEETLRSCVSKYLSDYWLERVRTRWVDYNQFAFRVRMAKTQRLERQPTTENQSNGV
jgi:hypothetical protein